MSQQVIKQLFHSFQKGDEQAISFIVNIYSKRLMAYAFKLVHSKVISQEIVQDSFIALWERRKSIKSHQSVLSYLFRVCYNLASDYVRMQIKERECMKQHEYFIEPSTDFCCNVSKQDFNQLVCGALSQMPARRRKVFEMSRLQGLSHEEIATLLNISVKTVYSHIDHALSELRAILIR